MISSLLVSPSLGLYVQELTINPGGDGLDGWLYKALRTLPSLLPNLHRLTFRSLPFLQPSFFVMASRFTSVAYLHVHELRHQSLREILRLATRFQNLQDLIISNCKWNTPATFYSGRGCRLLRLRVSGCRDPRSDDEVLTWLVASGSVPLLQHLHFTCRQLTSLHQLLPETYQTLHALHLRLFIAGSLEPMGMSVLQLHPTSFGTYDLSRYFSSGIMPCLTTIINRLRRYRRPPRGGYRLRFSRAPYPNVFP